MASNPDSSISKRQPDLSTFDRLSSTTLQTPLKKQAPTSSTSSSAISTHSRTRSIQSSNGTPLSARASVRKATMSASAAESTQLLDDLREQLKKAEQVAEDLKRQNQAIQARLDESDKEQAKLEEKIHEDEERIEELENAKKDTLKQKRELESIYEAERAAAMKDKESTMTREEELQNVIQRLKESLSNRDPMKSYSDDINGSRSNSLTPASSSPPLEASHFPPHAPLTRNNSSRNNTNSKLLLQKDKLIEELRLELAELEIKLMELENQGGGRVQDLEKALIEARVTNARLMEENESFQTLLMERTLHGDFSQRKSATKRQSSDGQATGSLADELSALAEEEEDDHDGERMRKLEIEVERQKAENKALTIYINKIIERILAHQGGFETILSTNDDEAPLPSNTSPNSGRPILRNIDKDLPPPPATKESTPSTSPSQEPKSFLQRARNMAYGRKQRPLTYMDTPPQPSFVENPSTAPSIPLSRNQSKRSSMMIPRRTQFGSDFNPNAAVVVGSMVRHNTEDNSASISASPGIHSPRSAYFGLMNRVSSGNLTNGRNSPAIGVQTPELAPSPDINEDSSTSLRRPHTSDGNNVDALRRSALDALTGNAPQHPLPDNASLAGSEVTVDTPSPPRNQIFTGKQIRPLRLVTEEQQKKNNRQSWVPNMSQVGNWFNNAVQGTGGATPTMAHQSPPNQIPTTSNPTNS